MLSLKVSGAKELGRRLKGMPRDVLIATVNATNNAQLAARDELRAEVKRVFDRPTPLTQRTPQVRFVTLAKPIGEIFLRDPHWNAGMDESGWLWPQVHGGSRVLKRMEEHLRRINVLPAGMYAVPGKAAKMDAYGNMSRGQVQQVLSALGAHYDPYQNVTRRSGQRARKKNRDVFWAGRPGPDLPMGVWALDSTHMRVRPILIFVRKPRYRKRLDFYGLAKSVLQRELPRQFNLAMERRLSRYQSAA